MAKRLLVALIVCWTSVAFETPALAQSKPFDSPSLAQGKPRSCLR